VAETHAVEDGAEPRFFMISTASMICSFLIPATSSGNIVAPDNGPECVEEVVVVSLFHLQVDISHLSGVGVPGIDDDDLAALVALAGEEPAGGRSSSGTCAAGEREPGLRPSRR